MVAEMRAEQIGRAARTDMQLTVPVRPVLRRGVRLRGADDAVVLDGADRGQAFSGGFAREGLIPLAEACDGTRDHAALARELGLDEAVVYKCLALLWTAGAIEEAASGEEPPVEAELAVFLSRLGNSTGANRSWADAATRLARRPVRLEGDAGLVTAARRALQGACRVITDPAGRPGAGDELTVFFETASSAPLLAAAEERCRQDGRPLLRVRADARTVVIGPYADLSITPCLDCGRHGEAELSGELPEHLSDFVAGLASHHVTALTARATLTHLPVDSSVIDLATLATTHLPATTRPGCPRCSFTTGPVAPQAPAGAVYEASVAIPPRAFLSPKDHQAHYYATNLRLQSQFKDWPSRPHTPLPIPDFSLLAEAERHEPSRGGVPLALDALALVLKTAFGVKDDETTPERVKRWTAAAGNIGCTTAYVVSRDERVLPPGVYAYAQGSHTLASVSDTVPPGDAPCDIVVTGDLRKVMTKYGTFGFRLAFLDAGCALTSAREVAQHLGLRFAPASDWDDDALARVLGTSPADEPVVAVATLGGTA
ncbi:nitroreductase family protein [Streptomyces sp. ET3-23]|uniref:nitroreductase family protein n=1 Tax=Streptomyces sp. ET3-23 TaxID=2885643 RepID=UPI001D0F8D97|nr:nitroreductase family protein [Streptomyces sp. ET3-23]MCC2278360.1 nitroreductase family protein [Streptomyces sp. ET3-23]